MDVWANGTISSCLRRAYARALVPQFPLAGSLQHGEPDGCSWVRTREGREFLTDGFAEPDSRLLIPGTELPSEELQPVGAR